MKKIQVEAHLHGETERPAQVAYENKLHQIVNRRIDPSSSLRQQDRKCVGNNCSAPGVRAEHHLAIRERAQKERRQESILAEQKQVLLVKSGDDGLRVF